MPDDNLKHLYSEGMFDWLFKRKSQQTAFLSNHYSEMMKLYRDLDRLKGEYPIKVRRIRNNLRTAMTDIQDLKIAIEHGVGEQGHFIDNKK